MLHGPYGTERDDPLPVLVHHAAHRRSGRSTDARDELSNRRQHTWLHRV